MRTINVRAPEGNIFCILGIFQSHVQQLKKLGHDVTEHQALLDKATDMRYDDILDAVAKLAPIRFTGRGRRRIAAKGGAS